MAGFKGKAEYSIDAKGRVALPAKMRRDLHPDARETFVITRGFERCVFAYPLDRWLEMERGFRELNPYQRETRAFLRMFTSWADEVTLDGQGRIALTKQLMDFASLSEKAVIIGALDRIEIWDPEVFQAYEAELETDFETAAERVMGGAPA
jgi:MraZ protein